MVAYDMSEEARQARRAAAYAAAGRSASAPNHGSVTSSAGSSSYFHDSLNLISQQETTINASRWTAPVYNTTMAASPTADQRESGAASIGTYVHDAFTWVDPYGGRQNLSVADIGYTRMTKDQAEDNFTKLPQYQQDIFARAAEALGGGTRTGPSTYAKYVELSGMATRAGYYRDPYILLLEDIGTGAMPKWLLHGEDDPDFMAGASGGGGGYGYGGGGFGGGGGGGPQINLMNENDARAVVNNLANQMLGRTVSDKEFKMYYDNLLQLQKDNPQTVEYGDDGSATVYESIGPDGIRYNLEEQMRNTEDFVTNVVGQQGMAMMEQYIASRRLG